MLQIKLLTDDEQHARICEDYWRQDERGEFVLKVEEIAASHGMKQQDVPKFVKKNAFVWRQDIFCVQCKKAYLYTSRAQYKEKYRFRNQVCAACIEAERRDINEKKKSLILDMRRNAQKGKIDLSSFGLTSKIFLLSTIKALIDQTNTKIEPLRSHPACTLSPDPDYDKIILNHLIGNYMLLVGVGTRLDAIEINENEHYNVNIDRCEYELAYSYGQISNVIEDLLNDSTINNLKRSSEFSYLCRECQLYECLAFLKITLEDYKLHLSLGEKTRLVLNQCLEDFSVAQVCNFIWRAVKDDAIYHMRCPIDKRQAANSTINNISRNMERALANNWDVIPLHRNHNLPQSALSHFIFDMLLGSRDGGFERPLHELLS
ncbi:hypothetical protein [Vreelandella profundi]|uniref:hypothetical protein n=1 Tax=Vreelandella profundi TaxID=2852117 RepID=UPI001F2983EA|nr:hypothetical protein [Halomonas profundi]